MEYLTLTVHEFRKNMKAALDTALEGNIVIIDRMGQRFSLTHIPRGMDIVHAGIDLGKEDKGVEVVTRFGKGLKTEIISIDGKPPKKNSRLATPKPINKGKKDYSVCKHGAVKGFCKKGCK